MSHHTRKWSLQIAIGNTNNITNCPTCLTRVNPRSPDVYNKYTLAGNQVQIPYSVQHPICLFGFSLIGGLDSSVGPVVSESIPQINIPPWSAFN